MKLSHRIIRQPNVRYIAAGLFAACAPAALLGLSLLGASTPATIVIPLAILVTAIPVALAPTATMDRRWFWALPGLIVFWSGVTMWAVAPDVGPVAVIFIFIAPLVVVCAESRRDAVAMTAVATGVMLSPVIAGQATTPGALTVLAAAVVMWGIGLMTMAVWQHAEDVAEQLDELAQRDALTGLGNRRHLDERLEYELVRHARNGRPLTLVVLDLNGFKEVNDTLGHAAGDDVLREVAIALVQAVRGQDTVARPGGDEFCVIAPETGAEAAPVLVEHLRKAVGSVRAGDMTVAAALGCAVFPYDGRASRKLFESADAAQRQDKPDGRGRPALADAG